jgi:cellulose synthase/poly-beta-1,6-N-acetylglucosamine synthase-like glycosyltransferase
MTACLLTLGFSSARLGLVLFGFGASAMFYVYLGYPTLLWILSRFKRPALTAPSGRPGISMIIAAHNEAAGIRQKLEDTLRLCYPPERLQILVASDGSTDGTDDIVREFKGRGVELVSVPVRAGKTQAQNIAVQHAVHEILVFSDATTVYDPHALSYLAGNYANPRVGAVSGCYRYYDPTETSPTAGGTVAFWNFENWIKTMQSRVHTISGCCGCIYSVRQSLYTRLPSSIISDLVQPLQVLLQGFQVLFENRAVAWEQTTTNSQDEFRMRVRVITRGMRGLMSVPALLMPWTTPWIAFQLWSHKVLRWFTPIFVLCIFLGSALLIDHQWAQLLFITQSIFYLTAAFAAMVPAFRRSRLLNLPLYFCSINAASMVSLFQLLEGRHFTVWEPVRR